MSWPPSVHVADVNVFLGEDATFTVEVTGDPAPIQQWFTSPYGGGTWDEITGATETTLTVVAPTLDDRGRQYRVRVFNEGGQSAYSNTATLTVNEYLTIDLVYARPASEAPTEWKWITAPTVTNGGRTLTGTLLPLPYRRPFLNGVYVYAIFDVDVDGDTLQFPTDHLVEQYWLTPWPYSYELGFGEYDITITLGPEVTGSITGLSVFRESVVDYLPYPPSGHIVLTYGTGAPVGPYGGPHSNDPPPEPGTGVYAATIDLVSRTMQSGYELATLVITPPAAAVGVATGYTHLSGGIQGVPNTDPRQMPPVVVNWCRDSETGIYSLTVRPQFDYPPPGDSDWGNDATVVTMTSSVPWIGYQELDATPDHGQAPLSVAFDAPGGIS